MAEIQNIDRELLESYIDKNGLKKTFIVEKLGISRAAFDKKVKGVIPFRASEIYVIKDLCKIGEDDTAKIFYPECIQK